MKVLLVDDDRDLVDLLSYTFQKTGYNVVTAFDGDMALNVLKSEVPDLMVLDLMMPKRDGMQVLKEARRDGDLPIIMLTALGDEDHVVGALELGADDYLVKPFRPRELRARAQSLLRRSRQSRATQNSPVSLVIGDIKLDPNAREVTVAGELIQLTRTEFDLLYQLMRNRDCVIRSTDLIAHVWGYDADENDDVVKVNISRLRRKIEPDPAMPRYIVTAHGVGYKFQSKAC